MFDMVPSISRLFIDTLPTCIQFPGADFSGGTLMLVQKCL